jgi:hypothetical protein
MAPYVRTSKAEFVLGVILAHKQREAKTNIRKIYNPFILYKIH